MKGLNVDVINDRIWG